MADTLNPAARARRFELFALMRRLECRRPDLPRLGEARGPHEEAVRFGQDPDLRFAAGEVARMTPAQPGQPPRVAVRAFGLTGPRGPLPATMTEYIDQRVRLAGDRTWQAFLDMFQHRLICLYYRAWASAQPVIGTDRAHSDPFTRLLAATTGHAGEGLSGAESRARLWFAGLLGGRQRHAEGLERILTAYFGVGARITPCVGHWLAVGADHCTRLGRSRVPLGQGCMVGTRVWTRQQRFRLTLGPLGRTDVARFLPDGRSFPALVRWIGDYCGARLDWQLELHLTPEACTPARLGGGSRIGRTSWLGTPASPCLHFHPDMMQRTPHG